MRFLIRLFPFNCLSSLVGILAESCLSRKFIGAYARFYGIDLGTATRRLGEYRSLADFFVREIKPEFRPIGDGVLSPVDGLLRSFGQLRGGRLSGIKGQDYSVEALLGDKQLAGRYEQGTFFNFYLSPADCHHVFAPVAGELLSTRQIPGRLFPVNDWGCTWIPELFSQNRRAVMSFQTSVGLVTIAMVGATNVGRLVIYEQPNSPAGGRIGTFFLGSSVVLLFEPGRIVPLESLKVGVCLRYGQAVAQPV